jgi:hypothetical protein
LVTSEEIFSANWFALLLLASTFLKTAKTCSVLAVCSSTVEVDSSAADADCSETDATCWMASLTSSMDLTLLATFSLKVVCNF